MKALIVLAGIAALTVSCAVDVPDGRNTHEYTLYSPGFISGEVSFHELDSNGVQTGYSTNDSLVGEAIELRAPFELVEVSIDGFFNTPIGQVQILYRAIAVPGKVSTVDPISTAALPIGRQFAADRHNDPEPAARRELSDRLGMTEQQMLDFIFSADHPGEIRENIMYLRREAGPSRKCN